MWTPSRRASWLSSLVVLAQGALACGSHEEAPEPTREVSHEVAEPAPSVPSAALPTPPEGPSGMAARALDALLAQPFCEDELCIDPFPLHAIEHAHLAGERIALSGLGGWVGIYEGDAWRFVRAPEGLFVHDAAFAPDGTLYAVADPNALLVLEGSHTPAEALVVRARMTRSGLRSVLTAVLPIRSDEIWVGSMFGRVARWDGAHFIDAPGRGTPRTTIGELARLPDGAIVAVGELATGVLVEGAWRDATTRAQWAEVGTRNGCWDADGVDEVLADGDITGPRGRRYEGTLPSLPDGSVRALGAGLDERRAALLAALLDDPPTATLDEGTSGDDWIRIVRRRSGSLAVWARIDGQVHVLFDPPPALAAVSIAEHVASVVTVDGTLYRVPAAGFSDPSRRTRASVVVHAPVRDVLSIDHREAWVLTSDGEIHRVRDAETSLLHASRRILTAIAGSATDAYAVGRDGAVVHLEGTTWSTLPLVTRADLVAVSTRGTGEALAVGDAGTALTIRAGQNERGEPVVEQRVLPRATHDTFEGAWAEGEVLFVRSARELFRWNGAWQRIDRAVPGDRESLGLARWQTPPDASSHWRAVVDPLPPIALDVPDAAAPTGVWDRFHLSPTPFRGTEATWDMALRDRRTELIHYETSFCCDPRGDLDELMTTPLLEGCSAPDATCDAVPVHPALGYDARRNELLRAVPLSVPDRSRFDAPRRHPAYGGDPCVPVRLEIVAIETGRVTEGASLACEDVASGWRALAGLSRFVPWSAVFSEEGEDVLAVHRTPEADTLVSVSPDLRSATVLATLARPDGAEEAPVEAWGRVEERFVSPDFRWTRFVAAFDAGDVTWIIRMPAALEERAVAACRTIYVTDPDGSTRVRSEPSARAEVVGEIAAYQTAQVLERAGRWIRIASPAGWVFSDNVRCE